MEPSSQEKPFLTNKAPVSIFDNILTNMTNQITKSREDSGYVHSHLWGSTRRTFVRHESFACHTKILLTWAARVALPSDRLILMLVSIETQWCHALLCSAVTIRIQVAPEANVDSESPGVSVNGNGGTPIAGWFIVYFMENPIEKDDFGVQYPV